METSIELEKSLAERRAQGHFTLNDPRYDADYYFPTAEEATTTAEKLGALSFVYHSPDGTHSFVRKQAAEWRVGNQPLHSIQEAIDRDAIRDIEWRNHLRSATKASAETDRLMAQADGFAFRHIEAKNLRVNAAAVMVENARQSPTYKKEIERSPYISALAAENTEWHFARETAKASALADKGNSMANAQHSFSVYRLESGKTQTFTNAYEAGVAFFNDRAERPSVFHKYEDGSARHMAETLRQPYNISESPASLVYEKVFSQSLPNSDEVDVDFRAGYLQALELSVNERLKATDWVAAKSQAPLLAPQLSSDLVVLAGFDFEKAVKAWETHAPEGTTPPAIVDREWKRQKEELRRVADTLEAERGPAYGVMTLDDKPVTSIRFERSEKDGEQTFNVSFHMGNKTVGRLKGIDADTLADSVGDRNAKAIMEHGEAKGSLKGEALMNEYGITPEENARRSAIKEARKAADSIQIEPDAADEKNIVEPFKVDELEVIDGKEVVARANLLRQREREQLAREQEVLGIKAESKRIDVENLSEKALEQDAANDIAERTGGTTDRASQQITEREKNRQVELMEQVHNQFRVSGAKFYFKDQPDKLAMKDKGERMVSASNDERVAKAMATMAEAKGWKTIKISGHPDFRREVWMEASLRGIEVRGYKPSQQELKLLENMRERAMRNTVEHERKIEQQRPERASTPDSRAKAPETVGNAVLRTHAGRVLEHGAANFNHDPEEKPNYFVKLETAQGEKTIWGVDLKRAMTESKVKPGDDVTLEYRGNTPVTVEALKRDKNGNVIGKEEITTNRNQWDVQKSDNAKVVESVASALIDAKVKDPAQRKALKAAVGVRLADREKANKVPAVQVYDKAAPSKMPQPERTGPVVERNAERVR
jgi:putative DNA primase/helicase